MGDSARNFQLGICSVLSDSICVDVKVNRLIEGDLE